MPGPFGGFSTPVMSETPDGGLWSSACILRTPVFATFNEATLRLAQCLCRSWGFRLLPLFDGHLLCLPGNQLGLGACFGVYFFDVLDRAAATTLVGAISVLL